jgi:hypothetical protein
MSAKTPFALLANATGLPWADVPEWSAAEFVRATATELARGARLCAWFGVPEGAAVRLVAVLAFDSDNTLAVGRSRPFTGSYPALTTAHPQAHLFEREVWEQHGLVPEGHPWLKPVRRTAGDAPAVGKFFRVEGREVHEVAVGPVHAGVIEPGHFRFQCAGEEVLFLEIALGYQHRGVEEALVTPPSRTLPRTRRSGRCWPAARHPCGRNGSVPSPWNSSAWRTTPAIWAHWRTTWHFCRRRQLAGRFAAISSI